MAEPRRYERKWWEKPPWEWEWGEFGESLTKEWMPPKKPAEEIPWLKVQPGVFQRKTPSPTSTVVSQPLAPQPLALGAGFRGAEMARFETDERRRIIEAAQYYAKGLGIYWADLEQGLIGGFEYGFMPTTPLKQLQYEVDKLKFEWERNISEPARRETGGARKPTGGAAPDWINIVRQAASEEELMEIMNQARSQIFTGGKTMDELQTAGQGLQALGNQANIRQAELQKAESRVLWQEFPEHRGEFERIFKQGVQAGGRPFQPMFGQPTAENEYGQWLKQQPWFEKERLNRETNLYRLFPSVYPWYARYAEEAGHLRKSFKDWLQMTPLARAALEAEQEEKMRPRETRTPSWIPARQRG